MWKHPFNQVATPCRRPLATWLQVQSGAGRTGAWWGHTQFDGGHVQPDLLVFAKGIASGYPLAGEWGARSCHTPTATTAARCSVCEAHSQVFVVHLGSWVVGMRPASTYRRTRLRGLY